MNKNQSEHTTVLISCVAKKKKSAAPARELYQSIWFIKAKEYAQIHGDSFFILSALYGLVDADREIAPYNHTLNKINKRGREEWASRTLGDIATKVPKGSRIIILAGKRYREGLEARLEELGYKVDVPMRGLGIGKQLRFLTDAVTDKKRTEHKEL